MNYVNVGDLVKASFFKRLLAWAIDLIIAFSVFTLLYQFVILPILDPVWKITELSDIVNSLQSSYLSVISSLGSSLDSTVSSSLLSEFQSAITPYTIELNPKLFVIYSGIAFIIGTLFSVIMPLYFKNGQTLGKKLMKIALAKKDGTKITNKNLFLRYYVGAFLIESVLVYALYYLAIGMTAYVLWMFTALMVAFFPLGRCLHDYVGGTVVVDISNSTIMTEEEKEYMLSQQDNFRIGDDDRAPRKVIDVEDTLQSVKQKEEEK
jgi:uncharacterized RDD family membrane protein YckC